MAKNSISKTYWRQHFEKRSAEAISHKRSSYASRKIAECVHRSVRELIGSPENKILLDAGCGDGSMLSDFCHKNTVIGLDFSAQMLRKATAHGLYTILGDLEAIPVKRNTINIIVAAESVTCLPDPLSAIDKLLELLKPDGELILSAINEKSVVRALATRLYTATKVVLPTPVSWEAVNQLMVKADYHIRDSFFLFWFPFAVFRSRGGKPGKLKLLFANNIIIKASTRKPV